MLQQLDYLDFIDIYHERIKALAHQGRRVPPDGRQGVYSGYPPWVERAGRFRSLGDGQVDFGGIFSKMAQYGYRVLGRARMGMLPQASRRRRARRRGVHPRPHHPRRPKRRSTTSPGGVDKAQIKRMLGLQIRREATMAIEGRSDAGKGGSIRLGMVGGGEGAFIGAVHRIAARLDDHYELVAGALSSTPEKARRSGEALGLAAERIYGDFESMAKAEAQRPDGIEAVAIVTPNHLHAGPTTPSSRPASTSSATSR